MTARLILAAGKERTALAGHPWIYDTAVAHLVGRARPGDTVDIIAASGRFKGEVVARAAFSPASKIRARVWTRNAAEPIDDAFFKRRVHEALARRAALPELAQHIQQSDAGLRLIHAENDGLPGVVADRYGELIVLQLTSAGADKWRQALIGALRSATGIEQVYERSDSDVRALEGLSPQVGWQTGGDSVAAAPQALINEHGIRLHVDIAQGHKTGFYLDQRDNRRLCRNLAQGRRVLNCFCYTGGFSLSALAGGAREVLSIDSSKPALDLAAANLTLNPQLDAARAAWLEGDVFEELRRLHKAGEQFDLIVLDPPKLAPSAAHADRAARAYRDLNRLAVKILSAGGLLLTFSCSGGIRREQFREFFRHAAQDAGRGLRILRTLSAAADHPVALAFPEGEYLKGLLAQG